MLQIEPIENFTGFGESNQPGEYYHSENFLPGQFGLEANVSIVDDTVADSPTRFNWIAERYNSSPVGVYGIDTTGKIFLRTAGAWALAHNPTSNAGNGLITGNDGNMYYALNQYVGLYDGATWDDTYKDLVTPSLVLKPMESYQDWILIGNQNKIAVLNVTDESFNDEGMLLPLGFVVKAIKSGPTGVLIGSNYKSGSVLFLWDVVSLRSISEWIYLDSSIQSICKYGTRWIVTTAKEQFITDGYSMTPLPTIPDLAPQTIAFNCLAAGTLVNGNKLYTANTATSAPFNRLKSGLYIQDLNTGQFTFARVANGCVADMTMAAMAIDSDFNHFISYRTNLPSSNHIAVVKNEAPTSATLVSPQLGVGTNNKVAEGVKIDISAVPKNSTLNSAGSFSASLKIYNFKRQLWGYGLTNGASSTASTLKVDGSLSGKNNAKVGDEVTILSGANAALVRHITSIANAGTNTETWTLDSALTGNTESGAYISVQPFQLVKTKSVSISELSELESIYFDIKNRIKGRKFLAKIVLSSISTITPAIPSLTFVYDDLGII